MNITKSKIVIGMGWQWFQGVFGNSDHAEPTWLVKSTSHCSTGYSTTINLTVEG